MRSSTRGKSISTAEIVSISHEGIWLSVHDQEFFLSHQTYPWFTTARLCDVYDVELLHRRHLYWKRLDVDVDLDALEHPEHYPLIFH